MMLKMKRAIAVDDSKWLKKVEDLNSRAAMRQFREDVLNSTNILNSNVVYVSFLTIYSHELLTLNRYEYSIKKEDNENDEKLKILMNNDEKEDENIDDEKFVQEVNDANDEKENDEKEKNEKEKKNE